MQHECEPSILAQSARWFVLSKPARWHCIQNLRDPDETSGPTVESWLRRIVPETQGLPEAGLLHRLDFETTGCLAAARTMAALSDLQPTFRGPAADAAKVYQAMVAGKPVGDSFKLFFTSRHRGSQKVTVGLRGEPVTLGQCNWRVRSQPSADRSLLEIHIIGPGKRHQIRAGFAFLGHPLLGDGLYGGKTWSGGLALHSWRLQIEGQWVECPLPAMWDVVNKAH